MKPSRMRKRLIREHGEEKGGVMFKEWLEKKQGRQKADPNQPSQSKKGNGKGSGISYPVGSGARDSVVYTPCHTGSVKVFADPKSRIVVWAGGSTRSVSFEQDDVVLDLADNFVPTVRFLGNICLPGFEEEVNSNIRIVRLKWTDGSTPNVTRHGWDLLVEELRELDKVSKKPFRLVVCCMGGHGRTGTALAILMYLMTGEKQPIEKVRQVYCDECVESVSQVKYIGTITGLDVSKVEETNARRVSYYPAVGGASRETDWKSYYLEGYGGRKGGAARWGADEDWLKTSGVMCKKCGGEMSYGICSRCHELEKDCTCLMEGCG